MLPDGWSQKKLGEFMEFKNGLNSDKGSYGQGTKFVNVMDIFSNGFLNADTVIGSMQSTDQQLQTYSVVKGDILFNRTSETKDEIALSSVYLDAKPIVFGGFVIRGRQTENVLSHEFSGYCFQADYVRKAMIARGQGAIRSNIGQKDLATVQLIIPSMVEQKAIADTLLTWDQAIEKTEKLIANSQAQKKALMQQLLTGKKRLPGFEGEWQVKMIDELFEITTGKSKSALLDDSGDFLVVDMGAIDRQGLLCANKKICTRQEPLQKGDLVMPKDDIGGGQIIGRVAYIPNNDQFELGDHVFRLRLKSKTVLAEFGYFIINSSPVRNNLRRTANGTAQLGLNAKDVRKQTLRFPGIAEQRAIAEILIASQTTIDRLSHQLKHLKQEKAALMQQLLTGKRRVPIKGGADG